MSYGFTPRQMELLRYIVGFQRAHDGISPSIRECATGIGNAGANGKSSVFAMLLSLEERGAIRRLPGKARAIEVLVAVTIPMIGDTPLYAVPGPWNVRRPAETEPATTGDLAHV